MGPEENVTFKTPKEQTNKQKNQMKQKPNRKQNL
jgi:hypothetical protein